MARVAKQAIRIPSRSWCGSFSMSSRLLNVAGSLSSALMHMSVSFRSLGRNVHLRPHGNPAPPRPRSSESLTSVTTESGSLASAFRAAW